MVIVLTHYGSGRKTIVNCNFVEDYHTVYDFDRNKHNTKITFESGRMMNVEETLEEIFDIIKKCENGEVQGVDWTTPERVDSKMEKSYLRQTHQRQRNYTSERNYNRMDTFNDQ